MSSTRRAPQGIPFRQERFASNEAYRCSLNALLVSKRCATVRHDPELLELIWLIQEQSLSDPYNVGNRTGSIDRVAEDLLRMAGSKPEASMVRFEDLDNGDFVEMSEDADKAESRTRADLVRALSLLALDPRAPSEAMPGLGVSWRSALLAYKEHLKNAARQSVAATSVLKSVVDTLRFTRETGMPSLTVGVSRLGKSAGAKTFCAGSGGLARYVLTPEDDNMGSFYRAIAKALGVADARTMKDALVRELVEKTLQASRLMLVFDEAHNLFCGCRRLRREPGRVLWLRRLVDSGVPVAFVALPDFKKRIARYVEQLDWDAAQITDIIARENVLPSELASADFELLVARLAPALSARSKTLIASAAKGQRGAQYVTDVIKVAEHAAQKAGRIIPSDDDVSGAVGARPQFQTEAVLARAPRRKASAPDREAVASGMPLDRTATASPVARATPVAIPAL